MYYFAHLGLKGGNAYAFPPIETYGELPAKGAEDADALARRKYQCAAFRRRAFSEDSLLTKKDLLYQWMRPLNKASLLSCVKSSGFNS